MRSDRVMWAAAPAICLAMAASALGTVTLNLVPNDPVLAPGESVAIEVRADFSEAIIGWGLDLTLQDPTVATWTMLQIAAPWDPAMSTLDGDLFAGTSLVPVGPGADILLATLTLQATGLGSTAFSLSTSGEEDEGFALANLAGFDAVQFASGTLTVPEPGAAVVLSLLGFALARRTRA